MDKVRATELLRGLADGINPLTGELLTPDCVCNQAEIVRAFHYILSELEQAKTKQLKPGSENAGKPWTNEDDQALCKMFDAGSSKQDICSYFKRSQGGIASRLVRLGKIQERDEFRMKQR